MQTMNQITFVTLGWKFMDALMITAYIIYWSKLEDQVKTLL